MGKIRLPQGIGMEISQACNRHCWYCPQSTVPKKQKIVSDPMWELFLCRLREYHWKGVTTLHLYNELSIIPNSEKYVKNLAELGTYPYLFSNGDKPDIVEKWIQSGAFRVRITEHPPFNPLWVKNIEPIVKKYPQKIQLQRLQPNQLGHHAGKIKSIKPNPLTACYSSSAINLNCDGQAVLCCADFDYEYNFGNITNSNFGTIWKNMQSVKKSNELGVPATKLCNNCYHPL